MVKKRRSRKTIFEYMTPGFWRAHYMIPATIGLVFLGAALGMAHFPPQRAKPSQAAEVINGNVWGWGWANTVGWIALNNLSACTTPASCGSFGLQMDSAVTTQPNGEPGHSLKGFAWSDNLGWICFGASCNISACRTSVPAPPGSFFAYVEDRKSVV